MNLYGWAARWGVPMIAIAELYNELHTDTMAATGAIVPTSEQGASSVIRMEAAEKKILLFRNNVGVLSDANSGRPVRYGLANDSPNVNKRIKSGDLIGVRPVTIRGDMIGQVIGQFVSREVKAPGWTYGGTEREQAQQRWAMLINTAGGDAQFAQGRGTL